MDKLIKEICKEQESFLRSAVESGYKRGTTQKQIEQIKYVHDNVFKTSWNENLNCPICILKLYRKVGEWFLNELTKINKVVTGLEPKPANSTDVQSVKNNSKTKMVTKNGTNKKIGKEKGKGRGTKNS